MKILTTALVTLCLVLAACALPVGPTTLSSVPVDAGASDGGNAGFVGQPAPCDVCLH
jgi:predicted component of type VI protein secretion system